VGFDGVAFAVVDWAWLIPALLQTLDRLWQDAPIGSYRLAFERLNTRSTSLT
jgi:hypothetical protein